MTPARAVPSVGPLISQRAGGILAPNSWTIDVDGVLRDLTIEESAATGKTAIRIDGKMAAKPLLPEERERVFTMGATRITVRRAGGSFDVETADERPDAGMPQQFDPPARSAAAPPSRQQTYAPPPPARAVPEKPSRSTGAPLRQVLLIAIVAAIVVWAIPVVKRWSATWKPYVAPDASFRISFPFEPAITTKSETVRDRTIDIHFVGGELAGHELTLGYFDLPVEVSYAEEYRVSPWFEAGENAIVSHYGGKVVKRWESNVNGHVGEEFIVEAGEKAMRGKVAVNRRRIFMALAVVPKGDATAYDVGQFLRSLELPDEELSRPPQ